MIPMILFQLLSIEFCHRYTSIVVVIDSAVLRGSFRKKTSQSLFLIFSSSNGYLRKKTPIHDINGNGLAGCRSNQFLEAVFQVYENFFIGSL